MKLSNVFQLETQTGHPLTIGDTTITLQSQALIVRWPRGGFVWNRPVGVIVERGGQIDRLRIVDVTRYVTWTLAGFSVMLSVIITIAVRRRS